MPVHDVDGALTSWNNGGAALNSAAAFANGQSNFDANVGFVVEPPAASDR